MVWKNLRWHSSPVGQTDGFSSHLTLPVIAIGEDYQCQIFWSPRDKENRSWIFGTTAKFEHGDLKIDWAARSPVLRPGVFGSFDSDGVSISDVFVDERGRVNLLYFGWQRLLNDGWLNGIGYAFGSLGADFSRASHGPLLSRDTHDPFSVAYPSFVHGDPNSILYSSFAKFQNPRFSSEYEYVVRKASWNKQERTLEHRTNLQIEQIEGASAYSRPTIVRVGDESVLLCSVRGTHYSIRGWVRRGDGWIRSKDYDGDSLCASKSTVATCYQFPFTVGNSIYLLYNGEGYGSSGFGLAKWE